MELSEFIKKYMTDHKTTQQQLADRSGLSKGFISQLVNDYRPNKDNKKMVPSLESINKLADAMGIDTDVLLSNVNTEISLTGNDFVKAEDSADQISMEKIVFDDYFPLHYCSNLSAGSFDELIEAEPDSVVYVPIKFQGRKKRLLAFKVNGTSMNNVIEDGSIVVVDNTATDGDGVKFKDGTIVVAYYNGLVTVKRLYDQEDKIVLMPDSTDKGHLPITIQKDGNQVTIIGKVIWHMNPDDISEKRY